MSLSFETCPCENIPLQEGTRDWGLLAIFIDMWLVFMVNVGKYDYAIHGCCGFDTVSNRKPGEPTRTHVTSTVEHTLLCHKIIG